jgi:hypothetical protein
MQCRSWHTICLDTIYSGGDWPTGAVSRFFLVWNEEQKFESGRKGRSRERWSDQGVVLLGKQGLPASYGFAQGNAALLKIGLTGVLEAMTSLKPG